VKANIGGQSTTSDRGTNGTDVGEYWPKVSWTELLDLSIVPPERQKRHPCHDIKACGRRLIMDLVGLLISVISGAVGGNIAGAAMQDKSLGTLGNSIAGILGGGLGGALLRALGMLGQSGGGLDLASIVGNVASGGVGGAILLVVVALIKNMTAKA
jgi:uncharacterized membrane protein YeaQ/YmgE (transglycosylase-associated protein family)